MFEAVLASQQQDNTTAYSTVTGLTLTPGAGTYLAIFNSVISSGAANYTNVGLAVDGSDIAQSEREHHHESSISGLGFEVEHNTHAVIKVGDGEAIQARWLSTTAVLRYMPSGSLTLISVVSGDTDEDGQTTDSTIATATPTLLPSCQFVDPGAGDYLAVFSASFRAGTEGDTIHAEFYVGGLPLIHTERRYYVETSLTSSTSWTMLMAAKVSPGATDEVEVRWWRTGVTTCTCHERTFSLLGNRSSILEVSEATLPDSESGTSDLAIDDLTHVNPAAGDYLAIGSFVGSFGSLGATAGIIGSIYEETTQLPGSEMRFMYNDSLDNMDRPMVVAQKVSPNGSEDVSVQWRGYSTDTRTAEERTFILLLDVAAAAREQENYRWRDDDADEDEAAWLAAEETNITRGTEQTTRLRILTDTATADPPSEGLQLEYKRVADPATEWRKVPLT